MTRLTESTNPRFFSANMCSIIKIDFYELSPEQHEFFAVLCNLKLRLINNFDTRELILLVFAINKETLNLIKILSNIKWDLKFNTLAVGSILKLNYDTSSNIFHQQVYNQLKLLAVSNRLWELCERYSIPLVARLVQEYKADIESRFVQYPTPLCNCYLTISFFFPEPSNI
ncbi:hypothetical protein BpHYR1_032372 [Brachionus plicatilis]|uniref:Uncharacterized protein n=1 Tax=Brachionus plicatilis TaxID=10195 RepID=A0A3M7SGR5_BRAPC|nr:hypothetical protein BpHYR1_032372 [Brachionus plicatilis]